MSAPILITGSSGFIGGHLTRALISTRQNYEVLRRSEDGRVLIPPNVKAVIHLAGRAHVMDERANNPLAEFRAANCDFALAVAKQAISMGVKRFVYVSSIGVNGGESKGSPFTENDLPAPHTPYAQSKHETEMALLTLGRESGIDVVIVRPTLVYGANAPGNFARLTRLTAKGFPLPFGAIHNRRSLLYVGNLVDFLIVCTHHPKAANQTFLLSDGEDVSTTRLLQTLAQAQGAPSRLISVPASWLRSGLHLAGKTDLAQRLLGNLQVDSSKARELLGWRAPFTFEQGIRQSV